MPTRRITRNTAVMLAHLYLNGPATEKTLTTLPKLKKRQSNQWWVISDVVPGSHGDRWGATRFQSIDTETEDPNAFISGGREQYARGSLVNAGLIAPVHKRVAPGGVSPKTAIMPAKSWKITGDGLEALLSYCERTGERLEDLA